MSCAKPGSCLARRGLEVERDDVVRVGELLQTGEQAQEGVIDDGIRLVDASGRRDGSLYILYHILCFVCALCDFLCVLFDDSWMSVMFCTLSCL